MDKKMLARAAKALLLSAAAVATASTYQQEAEACALCKGPSNSYCTWSNRYIGGSYCNFTWEPFISCNPVGICEL